MTQICPTVTAFDVKTFQEQLLLITEFADRIHIDLMDGQFTPTVSPTLREQTIATDKVVDLHVMYKYPQEIITEIIALRPHLVVIHVESEADIPLFASKLREHNIQVGVALLPGTQISDVQHILPHVQHVLIFGGHLGYHGGSADLKQVHKIADAKQYATNIEFGWDGGANTDNVAQLKEAGIDVINVGGCIHSADNPTAKYAELLSIVS